MNKYKSYSKEQLEDHFKKFFISSWSFSALSDFSRHEKYFEMSQIYRIKGRKSASSVAGSAYHYSLRSYFEQIKASNEKQDLPTLEMLAFSYIDSIEANIWKIQKTTPTIEECRLSASDDAVKLLRHFFTEIEEYDFDEIFEVEFYCDEFITVNGVDIPLPCHGMIDLLARKGDKIIIVDHKSKGKFTDEDELKLTIGRQAITYTKLVEAKTGLKVDECWFIENKIPTNRDSSKQLNSFKMEMTTDTRALYEALLYEPLKRVIEAVQDPNYVYMINDADNFVDRAEIYAFWAKTMISEITDFPDIPDNKKELIGKRLKKIRDVETASINPKLIKTFRENAATFIQYDLSNTNMTTQEKIEHILRSFKMPVRVAHTFGGYSSNTYLLEINAGVKINSIYNHRLDIANALDVSNVRLSKNMVVYEKKSYLAIETKREREKDLLFDSSALHGLKIPIGEDNFKQVIIWDLDNNSTPHALLCGGTGSGKSVLIKSTIKYVQLTGMYSIYILDPKFEFKMFAGDRVEVHNHIEDIETVMELLVEEMNALIENGNTKKIFIVFDEYADALASATKAPKGETEKRLAKNLRLILQKGRSAGLRVLAATQRASVKIIDGDTKVNFPVRICLLVRTETDSKVVLDEAGAESLAGRGDGLMVSPEYMDIVRFQAYFTE